MRVAIVHDWLTGMRGGERVLEALLDLFPGAEIFTLVHVRGSVSELIERRPIHTSFLNRLPVTRNRFRHFLPLFPAAVRQFGFDGFDLVLSSSHCVAKSVVVPDPIPHLCYCHTPMRYVWDQYDVYFGPAHASAPVRLTMRWLAPHLRRWDSATAHRPTRFVANSLHVQERIRRHYHREATVVYPPVAIDRFRSAGQRTAEYLIVSALVPYKRIDLAVQAFNRMEQTLVIVGDGPERRRLERMAAPHITFTGRLSDTQVADRMARCRAFVLPGEEDFGIAAVEAQAAGAPVIALGRGGALETVRGARAGERWPDDATGVFFDDPTPAAIVKAVHAFEGASFDEASLVRNARRFAPDRFRAGMRAQIDAVLG